MKTTSRHYSQEDLYDWLIERVAAHTNRPAKVIKHDVPLSEYGLDSVYALTLAGDIEDHLKLTVEPTIIWDYPTIEKLTNNLLQRLDAD